MDFSGKKILIAGSGTSGKAAGDYLQKKHARIAFFDDKNPHVPLEEAVKADFEALIVSPGFPQKHPVYEAFVRKGLPIIGEMELGFKELKQKAVGVTGTNGKTTVVTNITEALLDSNIKAKALGNIGTPLTVALEDKETDAFVLEISSFQLETLETPKLLAGCILNITPDHLDRYDSMDAYAAAKARISKAILPEGRLYVEEKTLKRWPIFHSGIASFGFNSLCDVALSSNVIYRFGKKECVFPDELMNAAHHDLENFLASYALLRDLGLDPEAIVCSFKSFKKPPHRIEFVRKINNISFFDDSKGTNVDAVLKAVDSIKGSVILIAGGVDKGASYKVWIPAFKGKVAAIFAIGEAREKIHLELKDTFHVELCEDLKKAVESAFKLASPHDTILLSPGCSSFDMFRDYKHRGEEFKKIVMGIS